MDELNKQNAEDETTTAQPGSESAQPVPPADTGAQQTAGESAAAPEIQLGKLVCPRCGNVFEPKEKKCPHCGMKNNLKLCKTCGATIAKNARYCPKCGAKNRRPIFKRIWFWIIIIILTCIVLSVARNSSNGVEPSNTSVKISEDGKAVGAVTSVDDIIGTWTFNCYIDYNTKTKKSANGEGNNINLVLYDDHTGTIITSTGKKSTEFEWSYTETDNDGDYVYSVGKGNALLVCTQRTAVDALSEYKGKLIVLSDDAAMVFVKDENAEQSNNLEKTSSSKTETSTAYVSEGKKNALAQANSYLNAMAFSYTGLREQLEYEGYSTEEATYAVDNCGAHWSEQAVRKAEEYLNSMSFSKSGLIEQLEYEGFTHDQAVYGADQAY